MQIVSLLELAFSPCPGCRVVDLVASLLVNSDVKRSGCSLEINQLIN